MVIKSAEDEGYSVFVIRPLSAPSAAAVAAGESILPNATADEVAASLGPPNQTSSSSTSFRGSGQTLGGAGSGGGFSGAAGHGDFEGEHQQLRNRLLGACCSDRDLRYILLLFFQMRMRPSSVLCRRRWRIRHLGRPWKRLLAGSPRPTTLSRSRLPDRKHDCKLSSANRLPR